MDVLPQIVMPQTTMSDTEVTQTKMAQTMSQTITHTVLPQTKEKKPTYKSIMAEFLKPLPKVDKPNIHLGGGHFTKLEKI
jgi:hypothetical protein